MRGLELATSLGGAWRRRRGRLLAASLSHARIATYPGSSSGSGGRLNWGLEVSPSLGGDPAAIATATGPSSARVGRRVASEVRGAPTAAPVVGAGGTTASTTSSLIAPATAPAAASAARGHGAKPRNKHGRNHAPRQ